MALRADGPQYKYRFTQDDKQCAAICGTALRDCTLPRRGCEEIISLIEIIIMCTIIRDIG